MALTSMNDTTGVPAGTRYYQPGLFGEKDDVNAPCVQYNQMKSAWDLIDDLWGGTRAMRNAGQRWLPMEPGELQPNYIARLWRSILFNGFRDTVEALASKPFSKPVQVSPEKEKLDEQLQWMIEDVDMTGRSLDTFADECFKYALRYGIHHVLIDYPNLGGSNTEPPTLDKQREQKIHPTLTHVTATNLIGWKSKNVQGGGLKLTQIRIRECRVEDRGTYGSVEVEYVRVFTEDSWELWRKNPDTGDFTSAGKGTHTLGEVPLRTVYFCRAGFMTAEPTLEDLAWLNLTHWQSFSDQRNVLRLARFATMMIVGVNDEEAPETMAIGPTNFIKSQNENAKGFYVEHSGKAIESGERDLDKLESRMQMMGMRPYVETTQENSATGKTIDTQGAECDIKTWVGLTSRFLWECFDVAAKWLKKKLPPDFKVKVYSEFEVGLRAIQDATLLIDMCKANKLSIKTTLTELQRRSIIADTIVIDEEVTRIEQDKKTLLDQLLINADPNNPAALKAGAGNPNPNNPNPRPPSKGPKVPKEPKDNRGAKP